MSWLSGWSYRNSFKIPPSRVNDTLTNFPSRVSISSSCGINDDDLTGVFDEVGPNWNKIAITTDDGTTECYVEKVYWDATNEEAELIFKAPSISATAYTTFYIYYDNNHADNTTYVGATTSTAGKNVWPSEYAASLQLEESGGGTADEYKDSTSNANHGRGGAGSSVATPTRTDGHVHYAQQFDGVDDIIDFASFSTTYVSGTFTSVEFDIKAASTQGGFFVVSDSGGDNKWKAGLKDAGGTAALDMVAKGLNDGSPSECYSSDAYTGINDSDWHHIVIRKRVIGGQYTFAFFVDGVLKTAAYSEDYPISADTNPASLIIGQGYGKMSADVGMFRYYDGQMSGAWIKASYYSWDDNFIDWGGQQSQSTTTVTPTTSTATTESPTTYPPTTLAPTTLAATTIIPTSTEPITTEAPDVGTTTLATLRQRLSAMNGFYERQAVTTAIAGNNYIICDTLEGSFAPTDDYLNNKWVIITSGNNAGTERLISDYTASTGTITVHGPVLTSDGAAKSNFELHFFKPSDITNALNRAAKENFDKIFREIEDTSLFTRHAQTVYPFPTDMTDIFRIEIEKHLDPNFSENILYNEGVSVDFSGWDVATYPNGAATPTNMTCSKYGTGDRETNFIPNQYGDNIMKIVSSSSAGSITWTISNYSSYLGQKIVFAIPFYCNYTSEFRIRLADGVGTTNSSYHGGTGWETLEVTHTVDSSATQLVFSIQSAGNTEVGYAAQMIASRAEYYLSHAWQGTGMWEKFDENIRFTHALPEGKFLRVFGKKILSDLDADTDTVERSDPYVQIILWGASAYLWRALANKHSGAVNNPYNERLAYAEKQLEDMKRKFGVKQPSLTVARQI